MEGLETILIYIFVLFGFVCMGIGIYNHFCIPELNGATEITVAVFSFFAAAMMSSMNGASTIY